MLSGVEDGCPLTGDGDAMGGDGVCDLDFELERRRKENSRLKKDASAKSLNQL
jgi:hypothetical protein